MGIFHYKLEIVPKQYVETFADPLPKDLLNNGLLPWLQVKPNEEMLNNLRVLLPNDNSWPGGDVEEYVTNNEWGSDCRIWKENGRVESIEFRYSPGADNWDLMEKFIGIVKKCEYKLVNLRSGKVLNPEEYEIKYDISKSVAIKFLKDPEGTIL